MQTLVFSTFSLSVPAFGIYLPLAACLLYIVNDRWRVLWAVFRPKFGQQYCSKTGQQIDISFQNDKTAIFGGQMKLNYVHTPI